MFATVAFKGGLTYSQDSPHFNWIDDLLFFYSGSQKQLERQPPHLWTRAWVSEDRKTVQGALETLLVRLRPVNEPRVHFASRLSFTLSVVLVKGYLKGCCHFRN